MADVSESWERFKQYYHNQLNEVTAQFKPDLYWFDGDWEHSAEEWESQKVRAGILKSNPADIINGRLSGFLIN